MNQKTTLFLRITVRMIYKILPTLMFFNFIVCMDKKEPKANQASLALSIALQHGIEIFDHSTICSSSVNKECEVGLQQNAKLRKEHLTKLLNKDNIIHLNLSPTWHKYGSACGKVGFGLTITPILHFYYLTSTKKRWNYQHGRWFETSCGPIGGFEKVQFNSKGDCVFYGMKKDYQIHQYTVSLNNENGIKQCRIALKKDGSATCDLSELITFPALFKALLMAKVIGENSSLKLYSLQDAIIPHNYKDWHKPAGFITEYNCFEDLPKGLKDAIESTYTKQNRKKSNLKV